MPQSYTQRTVNVVHMEQCVPCIQASQRYVGVPGLYGTGAAPTQKSSYDVARDVTAAAVAFGTTVLYVKKAPKKWKRPGKLGAVTAVIGLYFLTSFVYGRVTA